MPQTQPGGLTGLGKFISALLILALLGVGGYVIYKKSLATMVPIPTGPITAGSGAHVTPITAPLADKPASGEKLDAPEIIQPDPTPARLPPALAYIPKNNTIDIELSNYAGYAGLIVANGGLAPTENSLFFKQFGFKVNLTLSEEESWPALNTGKLAGSATTADVLAVYGKQFQVTVPAQISFSRGADGIVVRKAIHRVNDLKGRVLAASQFTESDFLIRYLAQQAGLPINVLPSLDAAPDADKLNLVYCKEGDQAGDVFLRDIQKNTQKLAGFVGWAPKTDEVAAASNGEAYILITNKNLLIIADILILNKPFATANPKIVAGLTEGLLLGNQMVHDHPEDYYDVISKAFKWDPKEAPKELAKVHLSNLPENIAFFSGAIDAAGSFPGIYQSAVLAYGDDIIKDPVDSDYFANTAVLTALAAANKFPNAKIEIAPVSTKGGAVETDPLLSKDIRFLFDPNSANLDMTNKDNLDNLQSLKQLLRVSPGSTLLLRGHVDSSKVAEFKANGQDAYNAAALGAVELSKKRANEIKDLLVQKYGVSPDRLSTVGRGWEEATNADQAKNRRVEAQWFTVE